MKNYTMYFSINLPISKVYKAYIFYLPGKTKNIFFHLERLSCAVTAQERITSILRPLLVCRYICTVSRVHRHTLSTIKSLGFPEDLIKAFPVQWNKFDCTA